MKLPEVSVRERDLIAAALRFHASHYHTESHRWMDHVFHGHRTALQEQADELRELAHKIEEA